MTKERKCWLMFYSVLTRHNLFVITIKQKYLRLSKVKNQSCMYDGGFTLELNEY